MVHCRLLLALPLLGGSVAVAQVDAPPSVDPERITVTAPPSAVTLYRGRASVTRTESRRLEPGIYALEFTALPSTIQPRTLQARVDRGSRVLSVDFEERDAAAAASAVIAELDRKIEETRRAIAAVGQDRALVAAQRKFIDAVSVRAASDAGEKGGTAKLDLDAVREQLEYTAAERARLLAEQRALDASERELQTALRLLTAERAAIGGSSEVTRSAVVTVAVLQAGELAVDLVYLVSGATWEPAYNVRARADGSAVQIEYDALLAQRTGEDWTNVPLTLSTAQPTLAANPPTLPPWYVDVFEPRPARGAAPTMRSDRRVAGKGVMQEAEMDLEALAADAEVVGAGPSVTFVLPRAVSVESGSRQQQRTSIAALDASVAYRHLAVPTLTEAVYVRGTLTNTSEFLLLPGGVSIFVEQDYVGPTRLDAVPAGGEFELHFGVDRGVTTTRTLRDKTTERTGLLSGGRLTTFDYRIEIDNGSGQALDLELRDRIPVSRSDRIEIDLIDLSHPLSNDPTYLESERPRGLLRWDLSVPATARGDAAFAVTYEVHVARAKGVEMTPLPD